MKPFEKLLLKAMLISFPFGAVFLAISKLADKDQSFWNFCNNAAAIFFVAWLLIALYSLCRLAFSETYRTDALARLFQFKNSDEREINLSGHATTKTYFLSLALMILMFFFIGLKIEFTKPAPEISEAGKLSLGFGINLFDDQAVKLAGGNLNYNGLPLSKGSIVIIFILLQLASYRASYKKISGNN